MRELYKQLASIYEATFEASDNVMPRLAAEFEMLLEDVTASVVFIDTDADVSAQLLGLGDTNTSSLLKINYS